MLGHFSGCYAAHPEGYLTVRWGSPSTSDWIDESMSWKETYHSNWAFLWERRFHGPEALTLFSDVLVNSFAKFAIGQSSHVIYYTDAGKIIHEGILSRLGEDEFTLCGRAGFWVDYRPGDAKWKRSRNRDFARLQLLLSPHAIALCHRTRL